ncbi:MAG: biopolymer transporter ExbD [Deltaproteobacteria bacterium]|nr:biopolymer transporter ExbD [Deltaproteobacteria bacterium]
MNFRPGKRPAGGFIDMTPVVDTIFNLLIFFALSMNFLANPGVTVDLPDASAPQVGREEGDIRIGITPEGGIRLDGAPVTLEALGARLRELAGERRDPRVLIRADRRVPHGLVVAVMDAARSARLTRLAIMTQRAER